MREKELLEKIRVDIAMACHIAPYSVFNDEDMKLLLDKKPKTVDNLAGLKGFPKGGARVTKWGEAIVACFRTPDRVEEFRVSGNDIDSVSIMPVLQKMELF